MISKSITSRSLADTENIASDLAASVNRGDVIAMVGDLGAGKTAFSKAFAKAMGYSGLVNSPTFTLLNVYEEARLPIYHFDCYRIEDPDEIYAVGFDEYIFGDGVCLIEWADIIKDILPSDLILVKISVLSPEERVFEISDYRGDPS